MFQSTIFVCSKNNIPPVVWMDQWTVPRSVICGLPLRVFSISFAFGSLLANRTVGPMKRGVMF